MSGILQKSPFDIEEKIPQTIDIKRLALLQLFLFLLLCVIVIRLVIVSFFPKGIVKEYADKHDGIIKRENPRGMIYDRSHNPLAYSVLMPSLFCSPADVLYPDEMAEKVASKLGLDVDFVKKRMTLTNDEGKKLQYVLLRRGIDNIPKAELENFVSEINKWQKEELKKSTTPQRNIKQSYKEILLSYFNRNLDKSKDNSKPKGNPLFINYEWFRQYPHHEVGGNIIGFVAMNDENRVGGMDGIEKDWDKYLYADPTEISGRKNSSGNILPSTSQEKRGQYPGANVHLTIDLEIQHVLEKELDRRIEECNAVDGMGVIMDPFTGAILAMASRPSYDPNDPETRQGDALKNKVLYELIEPGSTFKIVTASAGIEKGYIDENTIIDCEGGRIRVASKIIKDVHGMGAVPFWKCFEQSSNVAMVKVGRTVGLETLREYVKKFGFGTKTLKDISTERIGAISTNKAETTLSSMSIGYAVMVTPIQLARAYAVIANGGYLVEPYIVEKVTLPEGDVLYEHKEEEQPQVIKSETAEIMRTLCHQVVLKGTGKSANIPGYKVGGKTGTAHLAKTQKQGGGYDPDKIISIFAGFAPVSHPKVVAVIVIRYPMSKIRYGGYVCGPVFRNVVYYTLTRLKVPPDPTISNDLLQQEGFIAEESIEKDNDSLYFEDIDPLWVHELVNEESSELNKTVITENKSGKMNNKEKENKKEEEKLKKPVFNPMSEKEIIKIAKQTETLPDLSGLTKMKALSILNSLKIDYECRGYGRVVSQFPVAGTPLKEVDICLLDFSEDFNSGLEMVLPRKED
ncbi:MAG: penicillin-binding protein [Candidatus Hydrogenedens sp.]